MYTLFLNAYRCDFISNLFSDFSGLSLQTDNSRPKDEFSTPGLSSGSTSTTSSGIEVDSPGSSVQHPPQYLPSSQAVSGELFFHFFIAFCALYLLIE